MRNVALCAVILVAAATPAAAQLRQPRVFVSLNAGVHQAPSGPSDSFTFEENLETATVAIDHAVKGATLFDGGVAVQLWKRLGAGLAVSRSSHDGTATIEARIPHPFHFDQPREISGEVTGLTREETALHLQAVYIVPTSGRLRILLTAGPSRIAVDHEFVSDISFDESFPFDTATFRSATRRSFSDSAIGFNAGADVAYRLTRLFGVGGMIRYSRADVEFDGPDNRRITVEAGGLQAGGGIRLLF